MLIMAIDKQDRRISKGPLSFEEALELDKRRWELVPAKEYDENHKQGAEAMKKVMKDGRFIGY